jgi:uncharacterized membrane protein
MNRGHYVMNIHLRRAVYAYETAHADGSFRGLPRAQQAAILTDAVVAALDQTDADDVREAVQTFLDDMRTTAQKQPEAVAICGTL